MRIAFCGKGGSGKSTVSWLFTKHLESQGQRVLAIDADFNMDLAHNLGWHEDLDTLYVSQAEKLFYEYQGLTENDFYVDLPLKETLKNFTFQPNDSFTQELLYPASPGIDLIVAGPTHPDLLYGHRCSHAYVSSLKYYLPLLETDCPVVIDSVAGTDMVSYGMYLGVDAVVVVVEPTRHSLGVFRQISQITSELGIPTFVILNKVTDEEMARALTAECQDRVLSVIPADMALIQTDWDQVTQGVKQALSAAWGKLSATSFNANDRWSRHVRWRQKYEQQLEEKQRDPFSFAS